ncbi:Rrf2 family transcriptional regulator [Rhodopila sp.]|uniref:Rrf2 family transcriptional regulator n=1 Tax=Rhodopila sp. TaxID=2480087 RepID=UPI002BFBC138|nr:Rrf2 family transcriptional regulator [Rhodopila sp.]HVZ08321.1 Rrf2 family transcriptional regulator [Rhodopila sp.]
MQISTRGRYAVMAMVDLAACQTAGREAAKPPGSAGAPDAGRTDSNPGESGSSPRDSSPRDSGPRDSGQRDPSQRNRYGKGDCGPVCLAEIAARQQLSLSYLEQLFSKLRRAGLVASARGPGGGYRLARPASAIAIAEVVLAVDEPIKATRCEIGSGGCLALPQAPRDGTAAADGACSREASPSGVSPARPAAGRPCQTHDLWWELGRQVTLFLDGITLADVVQGRVAGRAVAVPPVADAGAGRSGAYPRGPGLREAG